MLHSLGAAGRSCALIIALGVAVLGACPAAAQWVNDGIRVSELSGLHGRPVSVSDGGGGVILAWQRGIGDILAQRLSATGKPLWGPDGVTVCAANDLQQEPLIVESGSGGAIIAWTDWRAGTGDVYAQRLNAFGDALWLTNGVALTLATGLQRATAIATDRADGAIVVWDDYRGGSESAVYGRRILASGATAWTANGTLIADSTGDQRNAVVTSASGAGDVIVAWEDTRRGVGFDIYAQRLLVGGSLQWVASGLAVGVAPGDQVSPSIVASAEGGAYVAWSDSRGANANIFAQGLRSNGSTVWTAGGASVSSASGNETSPRLAFDAALNVLVAVWHDRRSDGGDIYGQRLSVDTGARMWMPSGVALCSAGGLQRLPIPVTTGGGSVATAWTDQRTGVDVYAQAIDSTGVVELAANGISLCSATAAQDSVALAAVTGAGAVIAAWTDTRSGPPVLYAQRLGSQGEVGFGHTIVTSAGSGGKIVPGGDLLVNNTTQRFIMAPNAYSRVQDVRVDGSSVGALLEHSLPYVAADHTVSATFATDASSDYAGWITNGVPVATGTGVQDLTVMVADGVGGVVLAWRDSRPSASGTDIYAQRLNPSGQPMWTAGGVAVCSASRDQTAPELASDGAGGAIVVWEEPNRGTGTGVDVYAQRLDAGGVAQWTADGIAVASSGNTEQSPVVASDGAGGGVVAWVDWRGGQGEIYGQRLAVSGAARWTAGGIPIALDDGNDTSPIAVPDGEGGVIVGWGNLPDSIFVARVDSSGTRQWQTTANSAPSTVSTAVRMVQDIRGGVLISWTESGTTALRVQRVSHSGVRAWTPMPPMITTNSLGTESLAPDGEGGALVAWGWYAGTAAVSFQRLTPAGALVYSPVGVPVASALGPSVPVTSVTTDGAGGAIVAWADARGGVPTETNVYARGLSAAGTPQGPVNGAPLCTAAGLQSAPVIVSSGGSAIVAWTDQRTDSSVFVQRVGEALAVGFDHVITAESAADGVVIPAGPIGVFDGTSHTFTIAPNPGYHMADVIVDGQPVGPLSAYTFHALNAAHTITATFSNAPVITRIEPNRGGRDGAVSAVVIGNHFVSGATVKLTGVVPPDIVGTQVVVAPDSLSLSATFDLAGAAPGAWSVVVTNPDLSGATLPDSFTIEQAAPHLLRVDLVGPTLIRPNRRRAYDIVLENLGNTDLYSVPLWISRIPTDATVEPAFEVSFPPQEGGEPDWSQSPLTLTGPAGRYLALLIPRVPPGVTVRRVHVTVPNTVTSFELDAALTPPWKDGAAFRSCLAGSGAITAPACTGAQLGAIDAHLAANPSIEALSGVALWAKIAWQCEGAATLPAALGIAEQALDFMLQPIEQPTSPAGCEIALAPRWQDRLTIAVVTSVDPNDKLGSNGIGSERLIGAEQILPYSIRFENLQSATAPVQSVVVTDVLDAAKLDLTTVSVGPIQFGRRANGHPWTVDPGSGLPAFTTDLDLRPEQDLIVRVWANLDQATGVLGWSLTALDPETMELPEDPLVGFLPPNVTPGAGEGSLLFLVRPKTGLAGGTVIRNRATINFDGILTQTPEWTNAVDLTPPESHVLPLPANQDSASFTVRWESVGSPPDLQNFSVYVSEDGGAFRQWRGQTSATADTFSGPGGRTYSFYSLAQDSSGNLEAVPGAPDVQTYSRVAVDPVASLVLALEGAVPNPATTAPRVWFTLPSRERAVLEVMDVVGRRVFRRDVGAMGPGRHSADVSAAARRPGLYFLRLAQGGRVLNARMVVVR